MNDQQANWSPTQLEEISLLPSPNEETANDSLSSPSVNPVPPTTDEVFY